MKNTVHGRRRFMGLLGGGVLAPFGATLMTPWSALAAETWPARPIHLIVPYSPGGVTDLAGRSLADGLSRRLGTVVVENKVGGAGNIGVNDVVRSRPDGYTLLMATFGNIVLNPHLYDSLPFDPLTDLSPIAQTMSSNLVLVAGPSLGGVTSLEQFIEQARQGKRTLNMASAGNGSGAHILGEVLQKATGLEFVHVPYKGTGAAMADLLGGHVDFMFDSVASSLPNVQAGRLQALALTGTQRSPLLPNTPTFDELGYPGQFRPGWGGIFAPKGLPPAIADKLGAAIQQVVEDPEVKARLEASGVESVYQDPAAFDTFVAQENEYWGGIIQSADIKI